MVRAVAAPKRTSSTKLKALAGPGSGIPEAGGRGPRKCLAEVQLQTDRAVSRRVGLTSTAGHQDKAENHSKKRELRTGVGVKKSVWIFVTLAKLDAYYILVAAKMAATRGVVFDDLSDQELSGKFGSGLLGP